MLYFEIPNGVPNSEEIFAKIVVLFLCVKTGKVW